MYTHRWLFVLVLCAAIAACQTEPKPAQEPTDTSEAKPAPAPSSPLAAYYNQCCLDVKWPQLARVDYYEVAGEDDFSSIFYPIFSDSLLWLDSCRISLSGYAIPLEETGLDTLLVLSAFPYTQCFFCGNAGPESVVEVWLKDKTGRIDMDKRITVQGRLHLNDEDPEHLQYQIHEASLVK